MKAPRKKGAFLFISMKEVFQHITAEKVGFDLLQEARVTARFLRSNSDSIDGVAEVAARNIRTYESETLEDNVVSFYPYYLNTLGGEKRFFRLDTDREEDLVASSIDPFERDGAVLEGFNTLEKKASAAGKRSFFLWISPRGSAGTQGIYRNLTYGYHQIYMGETEGGKTQSVALKSDVEESLLSQWMESITNGSVQLDNLGAQAFLKHPVVIPLASQTHVLEASLFRLKQILSDNGKTLFYKNISIDQIPGILRQQRIKQEQEVTIFKKKIMEELPSEKNVHLEEKIEYIIGRQLVMTLQRYQDENGSVQLKGCAGGSISINMLFGRSNGGDANIFSTEFRLQSVSSREGACSCGENTDNHYHCPGCDKKYADETNLGKKQRTKQCGCGFEFGC